MMDILADVLSASDINTSLYFRAELSPPFAIAVPEDKLHIRFHLAAQPTWIELPSGEGVFLTQGDLVLIPHGSAHLIASGKELNVVPLADVLDKADTSRVGHLSYGEGPEFFELVCGHFSFNQSLVHPIIATLPPLIHIEHDSRKGFSWLAPLLSMMHDELQQGQPGYEQILGRLSETLFVHILRSFLQKEALAPVALTRLLDPKLNKALEGIHKDPSFDWSLERLSELAGMSRSAFADHFRESFNVTPMRYVTEWRMQKASMLLKNDKLSISDIAKAVGYASDASFSHKFKGYYGTTAGAFRKSI